MVATSLGTLFVAHNRHRPEKQQLEDESLPVTSRNARTHACYMYGSTYSRNGSDVPYIQNVHVYKVPAADT